MRFENRQLFVCSEIVTSGTLFFKMLIITVVMKCIIMTGILRFFCLKHILCGMKSYSLWLPWSFQCERSKNNFVRSFCLLQFCRWLKGYCSHIKWQECNVSQPSTYLAPGLQPARNVFPVWEKLLGSFKDTASRLFAWLLTLFFTQFHLMVNACCSMFHEKARYKIPYKVPRAE